MKEEVLFRQTTSASHCAGLQVVPSTGAGVSVEGEAPWSLSVLWVFVWTACFSLPMIAFILLVAELKEGALLLVSIAAVIAAGVMLANWAVAALRAILKTPDQPTCDASGTAQVVQQIREEP